jgi:hypothetical protein
MKRKILFIALNLLFLVSFSQQKAIWSKEKANEWYGRQPWLVGANFLPSTAINQLEMWQAESFDPVTIEKELGWARNIGMNLMRVYLHDLAWKKDAKDFKQKINDFLTIADKQKVKILFVFFDDCWNPNAAIGKQPDPKPGIHNSGWVRSPNKATHDDPNQWAYLETYVKDILRSFKDDQRILMWDLYNEPGNSGYNEGSLPLLKKIFEWAWEIRPTQPLTVGTWYPNKVLNEFQLNNSDVVTFHNYSNAESLKKEIDTLKKFGRPIICTEYMARSRGSRFETHLPIFKANNIGAINWGLVSGKSNTIYQWDTPIPDGSEPKLWFHDIFRRDGSPYDEKEVKLIKELTAR